MTDSTAARVIIASLRRVVEPMHAVLSVYMAAPRLSGPRPVRDVEHRWLALADRARAQGIDERTLDAVWTPLRSAAAVGDGGAVFACDGRVLFDQRMPRGTVNESVTVGAPAHVVPLLAWLPSLVPYVVVTADRTGADISGSYDSLRAIAPVRVEGPDAEVTGTAARIVRALDAHLLIVAGEDRIARLLDKEFSGPARCGVVVEHAAGGRQPDGSPRDPDVQLAEVVRGFVADRSAALLAAYTEQHGPSGLAVGGAHATLTALARRRVATLFVTDAPTGDAAPASAWFAPPPAAIALNPAEVFERRQTVRSGPLLDVAVRAALLGGANVHVVPAGSGVVLADGLGALCRFPATAA